MGNISYFKAIKRPFTDFTKLLIGILFNIVPILNFFSMGYIFKCATSANKKDFELPKWKEFGDLFVDGFFVFIIDMIYFLPIMLFLFIFIGPAFISMLQGNAENIFSTFNLVILFIAMLISLVLMYILPYIKINYILNRNFKDIFNYDKLYRGAFNSKYFNAWIIAGSTFFVITSLSRFFFNNYGLTGIISSSIIYFVMRVIFYTIIGEAYQNA